MTARSRHPAGPTSRPGDAGAISGDAGIGVHVTVNARNQQERQTAFAGLDEAGTLPDGTPTVEGIPNASEDHISAALSGDFANLISTQCVRGVNADTDDIALLDRFGINLR